MKRLAGALLLATVGPAFAGPPEGIGAPQSYVTQTGRAWYLDPNDEVRKMGAVGVIRAQNLTVNGGPRFYIITVPTPFGDFLVEIESTREDECVPPSCPDIIRFVEAPVGYIIVPPEVSLDEMMTGDMLIFEYLGG